MSAIRVMKFGGASVKNAEAVRNIASIIREFGEKGPLLAVISAMDKTTNHLEILAHLAQECREDETWVQFRKIRDFHVQIATDLFGSLEEELETKMNEYFAGIERIIRGILLLAEFPNRTYDRIVAFGELLSTCIVSHYLNHIGITCACPDARELIKTDATYSQARVIWSVTRNNIRTQVLPLLQNKAVVVTQGFIASSMEGKVTTLGREGSDYTGSIFASCLEAESLTVWKDVPGILNGDPRIEKETRKIDSLSYETAVEMTFYGATVIHPKTIKPLRNANIPLYVKCFLDLNEKGTTIQPATEIIGGTPLCSRIVKQNQVLLVIKPVDFSFMDYAQLYKIFNAISQAGLQVSLIHTTAISLTLCATNNEPGVDEFESLLLDNFEISIENGMVLKTYLNYTEKEREEVKDALVIQQADNKLLAVMRS